MNLYFAKFNVHVLKCNTFQNLLLQLARTRRYSLKFTDLIIISPTYAIVGNGHKDEVKYTKITKL